MNHVRPRQLKKLTPADIGEIRLRAEAETPIADLAREYNVSESTIRYHVRYRKTLNDRFANVLEDAADARRAKRFPDVARLLRAAAEIIDTPTPAKTAR